MISLMTAALLVAVGLQTIAASAQTRAERICRAQQLKSSTPLGPDGGAGNSANVFQVTNDSPQVCTLNGVPHMRLFDERNRRMSLKICANCSDYIFPVKASKPVKLRPGDAAHFLIGLRFADEPEMGCGKLSRIEVRLQPGATPLEFSAVGSRVCGKIDVSGWRAGVYTYDELLRSASFK